MFARICGWLTDEGVAGWVDRQMDVLWADRQVGVLWTYPSTHTYTHVIHT